MHNQSQPCHGRTAPTAQLPIAATPFNFDDSDVLHQQRQPLLFGDDAHDEEARAVTCRQKTHDDRCLGDAYTAPLIFGDEENAYDNTIGTQTEEHLNSSHLYGSHSSDLLS